jgi:hypothetical protein
MRSLKVLNIGRSLAEFETHGVWVCCGLVFKNTQIDKVLICCSFQPASDSEPASPADAIPSPFPSVPPATAVVLHVADDADVPAPAGLQRQWPNASTGSVQDRALSSMA